MRSALVVVVVKRAMRAAGEVGGDDGELTYINAHCRTAVLAQPQNAIGPALRLARRNGSLA